MADVLQVFVSSTSLDLQPERAAVESVLDAYAETKFIGMEHFGSRDETTRQASLDEVDRSKLYIGVFGGRWGSGITHDEYRRARARGLHCLIYFKSEAAIDAAGAPARDADASARQRRARFLAELKQHHIVRASFDRPEQLALQVAIDLHRWLFDVVRAQAAVNRAPLLDRLHDFRDLIAAETLGFEGRDALFDEVARFAAEPSGGYLAVVADAGLGKTAFAAAMARRWDLPAWFCSVAENRTTARAALEHLCVELILRWDLPLERLPPRAGEDGSFLSSLLVQAAAKARQAGLPLWLVVDALDEADPLGPGRNPLLLPQELPAGTYVLLTMRPDTRPPTIRPGTRWQQYTLDADERMQQRDIRSWLRRVHAQPKVAAACAAARPPVTAAQFVQRLAAAAAGNFKYLSYVVADIGDAASGYAPLDLDRLPAGLQSYYAQFWARMGLDDLPTSDWALWDGLYRPVLALLGAAGEPVTPQWLADHSGRPAREIHDRVLLPWRRFLASGADHWRIVHKSFADFLGARPELDMQATHRAMAGKLRADPGAWTAHGAYALRNLATHLRRADDLSGLDNVLADPAWFAAHEAVDASGGGFLNDVLQAWSMHTQANRTAVASARPPASLDGEVRCALVMATLRQRSSNHSPGLLSELVRSGYWTAATALAAIDVMHSAGDRDAALQALAPVLPDAAGVQRALERRPGIGSQTALWHRLAELGDEEAALQGSIERLDALGPLVPRLKTPALRDRAARAALVLAAGAQAERDRRDRRDRVRTLGDGAHIGLLQQVLDAAPAALLDVLEQAPEGRALRRRLPAMLDRARALDAARHGRIELALARVASARAGFPEQVALAAAVADLLTQTRPDASRDAASQLLGMLVPKLDGWIAAESVRALGRLAERAGPTAVDRLAARLLPLLARGLDEAGNFAAIASWWPRQRLDDALAAAEAIDDRDERRRARAALGPAVLRWRGAEAALRTARQVGDSYDIADATIDLLPALAQAGQHEAAFAAIARLDRDCLPAALQAIASTLTMPQVERALALADGIADPAAWARAVAPLTQRLAAHGQGAKALAVLHHLHDDDGKLQRLRGSAAWLIASSGDTDAALAVAADIAAADVRLAALVELAEIVPAAGAPAVWMQLTTAWHADLARGKAALDFAGESGLAAALPGLLQALGADAAAERLAGLPGGQVRARLTLRLSDLLADAEAEAMQAQGLHELLAGASEGDYWACRSIEAVAKTLRVPAARSAQAWVDFRLRATTRRRGHVPDHFSDAGAALMLRRIDLGDRSGVYRAASRLAERQQIRVLAALLPGSPAQEQEALVARMLGCVAASHYLQGEYMQLVAPALTAATWPMALELLAALDRDADRMIAAQALVARAVALEGTAGPAARVRTWSDEAMRAGGIAALAGHLDEDALRALQALWSPWASEHHLPDPGVQIAGRWAALGQLDEALAMAALTRDEMAYGALAPWLDLDGIGRIQTARPGFHQFVTCAAERALAVRQAQLGDIEAALHRILLCPPHCRGQPIRDAALSEIVHQLAHAPLNAVAAAWQTAVRTASGLPRRHAIESIRRLLPLAARLTSARQTVRQAEAAEAVVRRWR